MPKSKNNYAHCIYGKLIGNHIWSVEWWDSQ